MPIAGICVCNAAINTLLLQVDIAKREEMWKKNSEKALGKQGALKTAKSALAQLKMESDVNKKLDAGIKSRDMMRLSKAIIEAGALPKPLRTEKLKLAVYLERELTKNDSLLKEGHLAIKSGDVDEVSRWQKKHEKRKQANIKIVEAQIKRVERAKKHLEAKGGEDEELDKR